MAYKGPVFWDLDITCNKYIYIYQMYTQTNYIECTESVIM